MSMGRMQAQIRVWEGIFTGSKKPCFCCPVILPADEMNLFSRLSLPRYWQLGTVTILLLNRQVFVPALRVLRRDKLDYCILVSPEWMQGECFSCLVKKGIEDGRCFPFHIPWSWWAFHRVLWTLGGDGKAVSGVISRYSSGRENPLWTGSLTVLHQTLRDPWLSV